MDSDEEALPQDILDEASEAALNLLPEKSRERYEKEYSLFKQWMVQRNVKKVNEDVILAYFSSWSKSLKSSSLWSKYSMLRATLAIKEDIQIKCPKVIAFLKRQAVGYKPKKASTFTREDVRRFISEAPNEQYLAMKVVLIIGVAGACRCDEMIKMTVDDIKEAGDILIVKIPDSKTHRERTFTVTNETVEGVNVIETYRQYAILRPAKANHNRFFVNYVKGKCTVQVIRKNSMAQIPCKIATFLELRGTETYTGHSFRRTSASLLVDAGGDILTLKRHGGWRSTSVAEGYIEESIAKKVKIANQIMSGQSGQSLSCSTAIICFERPQLALLLVPQQILVLLIVLY